MGRHSNIILTKADLCEDRDFYLSQVSQIASGVDVYCVSSVTGEGFFDLASYFKKGKTDSKNIYNTNNNTCLYGCNPLRLQPREQ